MRFYSLWTPWLYLALPLALLVAFFFWPMAMAFGMSLMDYTHQLYHPVFCGLQNYQTVLQEPRFLQSVWNTALFMVMVVPAMLVIPIPIAVLVNQTLPGIRVFRTVYYVPVVVSLVVAGIVWKWLYAPEGLLNYLLSLVHLPAIPWLVSPDFAMAAIALMVIWKGVGYYMMMYLAHLQTVSKDLYEAAEVDGATFFQRHWHVTLPHLRPTMAMVAIISTIGALKAFTEMVVMTRGGPVGATETMVYYIYNQAFGSLNLGGASAAGFLLMLLLLVLSLVNIRTMYLKAEKEAQLA